MSVRDKDTGEEYSPLRPYVVCATDILQYIPERHCSFFQDDVSYVSELSLPFSDAPVSDLALANIPRGKSISTLLTFSPEALSVINSLRKESSTLETLVAEPLDLLTSNRRLSRSSNSLDEMVRGFLNDASMRLTPPTSSSSEEEAEDNDEEKKEEAKLKEVKEAGMKKKAAKKVEEVESEVEYFDAKSGLWKMLGTYDEFVVTRRGYNAFTQATPHWSEKEPPSWDKLEESRQKCEDWLNRWDPPLKK